MKVSPLDVADAGADLVDVIRRVIREEVRRLVRAEALASGTDAPPNDDVELLERARASASRMRRARR